MPETLTSKPMNSRVWAKDPDDYYVEPDWVDQQIFAQENFVGDVWDPACGSGRVVRGARDAGYFARGTDKVRRCDECSEILDFFETHTPCDNIVSNPPYSIADRFIKHALNIARRKVVMILPARYKSSAGRSLWLETTPLYKDLDIVPRPSMPPGKLIEEGMRPGGGKSDFKVLVWVINYEGDATSGWLRNPAFRLRADNDNLADMEMSA